MEACQDDKGLCWKPEFNSEIFYLYKFIYIFFLFLTNFVT